MPACKPTTRWCATMSASTSRSTSRRPTPTSFSTSRSRCRSSPPSVGGGAHRPGDFAYLGYLFRKEAAELLGAAGFGVGAEGEEPLLHLLGRHGLDNFGVQALHHRAWQPGWADDRLPGQERKVRKAGLGER